MRKIFIGVMIMAIALAGNVWAENLGDGIFAGNVALQRKEITIGVFTPEGFAVVPKDSKFVWNYATLTPPPSAYIFYLAYNFKGNSYSPEPEPIQIQWKNGCYAPSISLKVGHYLLAFLVNKEFVWYGFEVR